MNGRKLYRLYAQSLGCDCKEFVSVEEDWDGFQDLTYKDSVGDQHTCSISPIKMIHWIIRVFPNSALSEIKENKN